MADNLTIKKFLDQEGVSTLWSKIAEKVKTDVAAEATARDAAIAAAIATEVTDRNAAIKVEADRAANAEASLNTNLGLLTADLEAEISAREGADAAINTLIGSLPEGATATTIVDYINEKTNGIATDAALGDLQTAVNNIAADYLKAADKTELSGLISAEETRATGVEGELDGRIAAVEADYLKAADKTELSNAIALKADATALTDEVTNRENAVAGLQTQIDTIMNNPDTEGVINSINEFTKYIADHGEIAEGFRTDIDQNKTDIATEASTARAAEEALAGRLDILEAIDHEAYVAADTTLKNELTGEINKKADTTALEAAVEALEGADTELSGRLDDIEAVLGTGEGSVAEQIATAKQEAITAAATDATNKANAAEAAAKEHATGLNTAMNARVEALEAIDHDHSNKALLDTYTQTEANLADAVTKKHSHSNLEVLEGITATKVSAWDAAEQNAKNYAKSYTDSVFGEKILALNETEIIDAITAASAK